MTGAQAGKNALENNYLLTPRPVVVPVPGLALSPGDKVVQNANNNIASELDKALNGAGVEVNTPPITDGPSIVEARDEAARSRNSNMALNQQHTDEAGSKTETVPVNDDLTGGKLVNPVQEESKGTWLATPDRSGEQAASNTGNTEGAPDTGGSSTVTPIPEQNKDDLAYLSDSSENKYVPSPKHALGGWGTPMDLSDTKAQEVLNDSIQGGKQRYGMNSGKVYEFQPDNVGGWHGYPIPGTEAPPKILREFLNRGDVTKAEYNKLIKGK
ncbi:hypothetical protein MKZ79_06990 [Erwinia sp. CGal63]